ncbi:hypothetical protein [Enterococcus sp. AZ109]|uniref:hypothetical protein n=1 Tax=Enterococcus sp. AZ109 TaxID=2774634 RepID=UPI003F29D579
MTLKEIRRIKLVSDCLLIVYGYLIFPIPSKGLVFNLVVFCLFLTSLFLRDLLPKEYRIGGTFLKKEDSWLEFGIEMVLICGIIWLLIKIS